MATIPASENVFPEVLLAEVAAPAAAPSGQVRLYVKADGLLYWKDDAGTEYAVGQGAPTAAEVSFDPTGLVNVTGVEVQTAIEELDAAVSAGGAPTDATYMVGAAHAGLSNEVVVTAPATGGVIPKAVRKAADETVNGSSAFQDDDALLLAVAANEVWLVEANIYFDSGTTPDIKFQWTAPAGSTVHVSETGFDASSAVYNDATVSPAATPKSHTGTGAGTVRHTRQKVTIANGANAGNLQLQWAQNTSNGSDTKVLANSSLLCWRLA